MLPKWISKKAINNFSQNKSGILLINVTAQRIQTALELATIYLESFEYLIWIAPANFLETLIYTNEIKKNASTFKHRIVFYAIESISVSDSKYLELLNFTQNNKTFCIIDNSLIIKNAESTKTKRLLYLSQYFMYKLILSAAPVTQGLIDFFAQVEFLDSKILKMNEKQFHNIFITDIYQNYMIYKHWSCSRDEKKLLAMIKPYILGHDLKKRYIINHQNRYFTLTPREENSYYEEKLLFIKNKKRITFMDLVQNFQKYYTMAENKLLGLTELLEEIFNRKEKAVIYFKFIDEINLINELNLLPPNSFVEVSGRTNKKRAIKAFQREKDIMLCTYGVEKCNLDMQFCKNIIYFSQTFDYRYKLQSLDSVIFRGIPYQINIYDFWLNTNLELLMKDSLEHKKDLLSGVYKKITKTEALEL